MTFEKFDKHGESFAPRVSIWATGSLGISAGAFNVFELTDKTYVCLYYDQKNRQVGLKFGHQPEPGSVKMTPRKSGGVVPCKAFLDQFKIDYSMVRNYVLAWSEKAGLYVFDLDLPIDDKDCPDHPHATFAADTCVEIGKFLAGDNAPPLAPDAHRKLAQRIFSVAVHHHLTAEEIRSLLVSAMDKAAAHKDKRTLEIHKILCTS